MKHCSKCGVFKPLEAFYSRAGSKDGLRSDCKTCLKARSMATYKGNPAKTIERSRLWALKNPEKKRQSEIKWARANKPRCAAKAARWRNDNPDRARAIRRKYRKANPEKNRANVIAWGRKYPEKLNAKTARWRKLHPENSAAASARRHAALKRGQPPWINKYAKEMKDFYKECRRCGLTADHVIPLQGKTVSGLHVPWNMQMLTRKDNSAKGNKLLGQFSGYNDLHLYRRWR